MQKISVSVNTAASLIAKFVAMGLAFTAVETCDGNIEITITGY